MRIDPLARGLPLALGNCSEILVTDAFIGTTKAQPVKAMTTSKAPS